MIVRGIGSVSSKSEKFMPFDSTGSRLLAEGGLYQTVERAIQRRTPHGLDCSSSPLSWIRPLHDR